MRLSEFWGRMERRLGHGYARSWAADQVLPQLEGRTVEQALAEGEDAKTVWRAVVEATGAPASER
ncbi:MAG TPA: DUF3046 domain-containing protein [Mycobacteriales bacterium]|nr:DUF3046 domain-containing protein [Mycobacteriales bacterium]